MCGVAGIVRRGGAPVDVQALDAAARAMPHRGPDGRGVWRAADGAAGLAHARLAIVDVHAGAQPMCTMDGAVHVVVNGELYDDAGLRATLQQRGHLFKSRSDSEVALHLYNEYGLDFVQHLRGEFALLLWDSRRRHLVAVRDRFGVKPLVYAEHAGALYLASEAKALFAAGVPRGWDGEAFFHAANLQYLPGDRTLFAGVQQLAPGEMLIATAAGHTRHTYWDLNYPREAERVPVSEAEATERVQAALAEAVRLRLRADVPVACHLSGGLDSATVAALAKRAGGKPLPCFTVSFSEDPSYDEHAVTREVAAHLGSPLHTVQVSRSAMLDHLPDAVACSEGLAINGHLSAKYLLSRSIRAEGYKVALSGEGADELFAGYAHLRHDMLDSPADVAALHATNQVSGGIMLPLGEALCTAGVQRRLGYVPSFLQAKATMGFRMAALLHPDCTAAFAGRDCFGAMLDGYDIAGQLQGRHRVEQSLYLWTKLALANYILPTLGDGTEMAHSIEGRPPFLDHRLFETVRALPVDFKIRGRGEKYIQRRAMRDLLPEALLSRQKHPFLAPPLSLVDTPQVYDRLHDILGGMTVPFFERTAVLRWLAALPGLPAAERAASDAVLITLLSAVALQQRLRL